MEMLLRDMDSYTWLEINSKVNILKPPSGGFFYAMKNSVLSCCISLLFVAINGRGYSQDNEIIRGPYLQLATQSSIIVRWKTASPQITELRYGLDSTHLKKHIKLDGELTDHEVEIGQLEADTRYYYSLGESSYKSGQFFETLPIKGKLKAYSFLVLGDCGTGYSEQTEVKNAVIREKGSHFDGVLLLGDNAYQSGTDENYQSNFFRYDEIFRNSVIWPAPGNHDYNNHLPFSKDPAYYNIFNCPTKAEAGGVPSGTEKYYSYDFGNIHFISIDSYDESTKETGEMYQWLKKDLDSNSQDWTVVYWHHPPYSKGSHNSDNTCMNRKMVQMRKRILPLLESYNVDLVLNGHSHTYERSMLLHGHYGKSKTLDSTQIVNDQSGILEKGEPYVKGDDDSKGTVYCVMGSSGKVSKVHRTWPHPIMYAYDHENPGALILNIERSELSFEYLTADGIVGDRVTILKEATRP